MSEGGDLRVLRNTRRALAELWLAQSPQDLPQTYGGDCGRIHRVLTSAAIRFEPLETTEQEFAQSLIANVGESASDPKSAGALLSAMLYWRAHRLGLPIDLRVQPWLIKDYLSWLIAPVAFFTERGESAQYAKHLTDVLEAVNRGIAGAAKGDPFWTNVGMLVAQRLDCTPAYANDENLRELQHQRGVLLDWAARLGGAAVDHSFAKPAAGRKRRLGIVARHLRPSSETFALLPVYEHLREHAHVVLYVCEPAAAGNALGQYCGGRANAAKVLPPDVGNRRRVILADDLDVLFYGSNLTTSSHDLVLLAQHRLARVQVTSVANVVTTGLGTIDYFLSGTTSDPLPDAAAHYTEKLFRLEGSAHCFSYGPKSSGQGKAITRTEVGLRDDQVVLASGANLYKMSPELLDAWAKILSAVPNAVLMIFPFGPNWYPSYPADAFVRHATAVLGDRVKVMNPQPPPDRAQFREYFRVADLYLDSFPFCGSTSLIEPLEAGLPIVTRGGSTFRSAMGGAMLHDLGLGELVAGDSEKYVALACELARNGARRKEIAGRIRERMASGPGGAGGASFLDSAGYARRIAAAFEALLVERGFA